MYDGVPFTKSSKMGHKKRALNIAADSRIWPYCVFWSVNWTVLISPKCNTLLLFWDRILLRSPGTSYVVEELNTPPLPQLPECWPCTCDPLMPCRTTIPQLFTFPFIQEGRQGNSIANLMISSYKSEPDYCFSFTFLSIFMPLAPSINWLVLLFIRPQT